MTNDQALSSHLWPHPFRWHNFVDVVHDRRRFWRWTLNTMMYAALATLGVVALEHPGRVRAREAALAGPRRRVARRPRRADAAAAGVGRPALRHVGEARERDRVPVHRLALAADHPGVARRRVLDLPAAPVLPDDPGGVPRRRARRRLRRVPHPHHGRAAAGEAGDRRGRALLRPLHVQRLLPAAAVPERQPAQLGRCRSASRSSGTCTRCSGT